jgi:hypothetical protein
VGGENRTDEAKGSIERGEEFEESNGRGKGDVGDEEGLYYGGWAGSEWDAGDAVCKTHHITLRDIMHMLEGEIRMFAESVHKRCMNPDK